MSSEKLLPKPTLNFPLIVDPNITSSDKVIINGPNSNLEPSIVTSLELSYLSGATSNIQDQINTAIAGGFKYNSTNRDPTLTDDSSGRYTRCSLWVNTIDNAAFICVDESVGSAVWDVITWDQPLNTTDDVIFNKVTASDGLDVVTGDSSVVNFKPGSQGFNGNFLKSDGIGGVYWGSDTGIIYNGTLPSVIGGHIKLNIADGSTVNESKLVEDSTNLNMGGLNVTNCDDITANKFIVAGGTNIQYLLADGTLLTSSANSGNSNFYLYKSIDNATTPPISSGDVIYNNANQSLATVIYVSHLTRDNIDIEIFFENISSLNDLYIQDQNNSLNYIRYNITGTPTIIPNDYILIPVIVNTSVGTGSTSFGTNHNVLLSIFTNSIETDVRISNLETKTQNQTATITETTFSNPISLTTNKITSSYIPLANDDLTNRLYVDGFLPKSGGTMTGDIVLGTNNITGTIGLIQGFNIPVLDARITTAQTTATNALPKSGGTMTGDIVLGTNNITGTIGLIQGFNIPVLDARITTAQTTATNALPKSGGTMTGDIVLGTNNITGTIGLIQGFNIPVLDARITTAQTTATNALPKSGGTMTGTLTTNNTTSVVLNGTITGNIYPTTSNIYGVGVSTLPYLSSEINSMNTKNIILHNSGRTFNTTINSANTSSFSLTLPPAQGGVGTFLQNNGSGILNWVSSGVVSPSNVQTFTTAGTSTYTPTAGTTRAMVIVQGSGGAGGGVGTENANNGCGAGGNAGSSYVGYFAIDTTKLGTVTILPGGIGTTTGGTTGGNTTFLFPSIGTPNGTITGVGGVGGGYRNESGAGTSGAGTNNTDQYIVSIGVSTTGTATVKNAVFLGGYAQTSGLGRHGIMVAANQGTSGSGGLSLIFGGGDGVARISTLNNTNTIGAPGTNGTGSGGSGAIQTSGTGGATGGAGGRGCVIIVEYF